MIDTQVWLEPEELRNIPDNSVVCRCKLLLSIKNFEDEAEHRWKARFVAAAHLCYNKYMRVQRYNSQHGNDWWVPTCSLTGSRFVDARSISLRRRAEAIDLITAYLQARYKGEAPIFLIFDPKIYEYLPPELRKKYELMDNPVSRMWKGLYGTPEAGYDFIEEFVSWLTLLGFRSMPEEPGVMYLWHTIPDSTLAQRAMSYRKLIDRDKDKDSLTNLARREYGSWSEVHKAFLT